MILRLALPLSLLAGCAGASSGSDDPGKDALDLPAPGRPPGSGSEDDTGSDTDGTDPGDSGSDTGPADSGDDTAGPGDTAPASDNPLAGLTLWVDPASRAAQEADAATGEEAALYRKIAGNAVAKWLGGWSGDVEVTVRDAVDEADADGGVRAFVVYNLPNRDCGGYSAGGAADADAYRAWIDGIAAGLGGRSAILVLEPDGLSMLDCLSSEEADTRNELLMYAVATLKAAGGIVYLDAGHSAWHPVDTMAERLVAADVASADGFALNTSNFESTADVLAYGESVSEATGGAHFVADTSRNGLGPTSDHQWCNPDGRALGLPPTFETGSPVADGLLWIKAPGESDGSCNGGPSAGEWWPEYARGLAERASW